MVMKKNYDNRNYMRGEAKYYNKLPFCSWKDGIDRNSSVIIMTGCGQDGKIQ